MMENKGKIVQVSGPVVDVEFADGNLPRIKDALYVMNNGKKCVMEVSQHIGDNVVRCIMLAASEGLCRDMEVTATGSGIQVPVGEQTLGRLFNVLGETLDGKESLENGEHWCIHREPPTFEDQSPVVEMLETGIKVVYDEYETNEIMYPKVEAGATAYDVLCPSDYMIQKLIENDLLQEINFDNIPNVKNIGQQYFDQSQEFDPENKYSIPYCFGTVGILYNKTMVDDPVDSWSILWDEKYADNILMQDSVRDAFMGALKLKGYSMNTLDEGELNEAKQILIDQKPLVQAYVIDQVRDKMIGNEAAIGVIYSGEAIFTQRENTDLEYVIPKEGTNVWIDSWVIPKNAPNMENAEKFIDFMCREDVALKNFEYITYSTPNDAARALIEDEDIKNSKIAEALEKIDDVDVTDNDVVEERVNKYKSIISALQKDKDELTMMTAVVVDNNHLDEDLKSTKVNEEVTNTYQEDIKKNAIDKVDLSATPYCANY